MSSYSTCPNRSDDCPHHIDQAAKFLRYARMVRTAGRAGLSMVSFPALPAVALQGGPVRHMSIRSSATGIPTSVRMKPGVAQFPRPGPEQIPVPARMSGQPVVSSNIRGAPLIRETGQPDAGHNIHARLPRHRTRSCPGNNGGAPGEQDGTGKTGSPDRRRDLPDLIRRTGTGIPRTGGFRARGHPAAAARSPDCGQDRSTSRRAKGFLPLAMPGFLTFFFTAGIAQIPARPLRRFPRAFREGISFQMTCR